MALARANAPSNESPVEAPVYIPILNSLPSACNASARLAIAVGTSFGQPAGVKPLNPTMSPSLR